MSSITIEKTVIADSLFEQRSRAIPDEPFLQIGVQKALQSYLDSRAKGLGQSAKVSLEVANQLAPATKQAAEEAVSDNLSLIEDLKSKVTKNDASWFSALTLATVWALMITAECTLNESVLPWIVGASGLTALALAGAASLTPLVFEEIFGAIFGAEPWTTSVPQSKPRKYLLASVGVLNLIAVGMVGGCRGIVALLRDSQNAVGLTSNQNLFVDSALVMLSLVIALDAGIIFLYFSHELDGATEKDQTIRELKVAETKHAALETAFQEARRHAAETSARFANLDDQVAALKEEYLAEQQLMIAARIANIVQAKDYKSVVEMLEKSEFFHEMQPA